MWPNPQFSAGLVTFTEEILNGKLHILCSACAFFKKWIFEYLFWKIFIDMLRMEISGQLLLKLVQLVQYYRQSLWRHWSDYFPEIIDILQNLGQNNFSRSSRADVFLGKGALKICSKFTGEHSCRSAIWRLSRVLPENYFWYNL